MPIVRGNMSEDAFWSNIFKSRKQAARSEYAVLHDIPLFHAIRDAELKIVLRYLHIREFRNGEYIFREGKPGVGMFIIISGRVKIFFEENDKALAFLGRGESFGEMALIQEAPRSASAMAIDETRVYGLYQPDLFGLIEKKPELGSKLLLHLAQMLAERLRLSNSENLHLKAKLAEYEQA
jgi:CRP/FNR family cyclic AMP-dependent transcriptional regulator